MINFKKLPDLTDEEYAKLKFAERWSMFHGKPKTRRDFMTAGLIGGGASLILPSILPFLSNPAHAAACASGGGSGIVQVDLQNGWSPGYNIIPLDKNGALLSSYQDLDMGTGSVVANNMSSPWGINGPSVNTNSGFMAGFNTKVTPAMMLNMNVMAIWGESQNDTSTNQLDATPMIAAMNGGSGSFLPIVGQNQQQTPALLPAVSALTVNTPADVTNSVGVQGALKNLSQQQKGQLFDLIQSLSATQLQNLGVVSGQAMVTAMVNAATAQNASLIANPAGGLDPTAATGFNTNNNFNFNNASDLQNATVYFNAFNGNSPGGAIDMAGYDYHGQGRTVETQKDNAAGVVVGQGIASLAALGKRGAIMVTSAGSVGSALSATGNNGFTGDDASKGAILLFFYDPLGAHTNWKPHVGAFVAQSNGATNVDGSFSFSNSPQLLTAAAIANVASYFGQTSKFLNMPTVGTSFQQTDFQQNVALATNAAGQAQTG